MKILKITPGLFFILVLSYSGWAVYTNKHGATLGSFKTPEYRITVLHVPYHYSLVPVNTSLHFAGYIVTRISDAEGREIASFSICWDSFYPTKANLVESHPGFIKIDIDGLIVSCAIKPGEITWQTGK